MPPESNGEDYSRPLEERQAGQIRPWESGPRDFPTAASAIIAAMDEEIPSIQVSAEGFMEVPSAAAGARRDEDIALDLMKFVAMATGYGKTSSSGVGFQGGGAAAKPEEYAAHLLQLYGKCLEAVQTGK
jgi:hypothetical protein